LAHEITGGRPIDRSGLVRGATVAVVVNTYNQAHFLEEALASCLGQTVAASEILVVDDGSSDDPQQVVGRFPGVRFVQQANAGLSASRNTGLRNVASEFVIFLDADDRLRPIAIEAGLECIEANPEAWMVYGAYRVIDASGEPASPIRHVPTAADARDGLMRRGNTIAMHATVMYRRDRLAELGGFDETLRACEDYNLYLHLAAAGQIAGHDRFVAEYRRHSANMSNNRPMMLETVTRVLDRQAALTPTPGVRRAVAAGKRAMRRQYGPKMFEDAARTALRHGLRPKQISEMLRAAWLAPLALTGAIMARCGKAIARRLPLRLGRVFGELARTPDVGPVRFGDLDDAGCSISSQLALAPRARRLAAPAVDPVAPHLANAQQDQVHTIAKAETDASADIGRQG
jgi:hypothetical protein